MALHRSLRSSARTLSLPSRRDERTAGANDFPLDTFIANVYLPHAQLRKRSWQVDERIARQHISPVFGDTRITDIPPREVEKWLHTLSTQGLAPSTCNRILCIQKHLLTRGNAWTPTRRTVALCERPSFQKIYSEGTLPIPQRSKAAYADT